MSKPEVQEVMDALRERVEQAWPDHPHPINPVEAWIVGSGDAEFHAGRRFKVDPLLVSIAACGLWGRGLPAERDRRIAEQGKADDISARSLQALRGHVTRRLLTELEPVIAKIRPAEGESQ